MTKMSRNICSIQAVKNLSISKHMDEITSMNNDHHTDLVIKSTGAFLASGSQFLELVSNTGNFNTLELFYKIF